MDDLDSLNIYLRKDNQIIGLHAIGYKGPYTHTLVHLDGTREEKTSNFNAIEVWGNEYDEEHNMLGKGSFRLNTTHIEEIANELVTEGWEIYEGPKKKDV